MSERPISEVLREFNDASYPGTNWPELMARAPELLAIVEAAKLLATSTTTGRVKKWIHPHLRSVLAAAGELPAAEEPTR
jgi:hypothetical protein